MCKHKRQRGLFLIAATTRATKNRITVQTSERNEGVTPGNSPSEIPDCIDSAESDVGSRVKHAVTIRSTQLGNRKPFGIINQMELIKYCMLSTDMVRMCKH